MKSAIRHSERENTFTELLLQCVVIIALLVVVNLLLCLIYKLNFITGVHAGEHA